jgi:hypothetical protein
MNVRDVYRTRLFNRIEAVLLFKPEAFLMIKAEHQDPFDMTVQIARNKTGYLGPWSPAELVSVDIDTLGAPYIDDADPITAANFGSGDGMDLIVRSRDEQRRIKLDG